jgi:hypothetical protein
MITRQGETLEEADCGRRDGTDTLVWYSIWIMFTKGGLFWAAINHCHTQTSCHG